MPRAPVIETIKDKRVLTDGNMTLELYLVQRIAHIHGGVNSWDEILKAASR